LEYFGNDSLVVEGNLTGRKPDQKPAYLDEEDGNDVPELRIRFEVPPNYGDCYHKLDKGLKLCGLKKEFSPDMEERDPNLENLDDVDQENCRKSEHCADGLNFDHEGCTSKDRQASNAYTSNLFHSLNAGSCGYHFDDQDDREVGSMNSCDKNDTKESCPNLDMSRFLDLCHDENMDDLSYKNGIDICEDSKKSGMLRCEYGFDADFLRSVPTSASRGELGLRESCDSESVKFQITQRMSIFPFNHDTLGFSELSRYEVLRIHVTMENVTAYGAELIILSLPSGTGKRMMINIVANHLRKKFIFDDFHPPQSVSQNNEHKNYVADLYGLLQGTVLKDVDEYEDVIGRTEHGKDRSLNNNNNNNNLFLRSQGSLVEEF
jgi:hypothetical protein